ncbi:MAG: lipid II:glycine glycyltransferase FemX [Candidatus Saccharimonadia bacterium]
MSIEPGLPPKSWDTHQRTLGGHFLQSRGWAEFQIALGRIVLFDHAPAWSFVATERASAKIKYLNLSYGPTLSENSLPDALSGLMEYAKSNGQTFIRIEPMGLVSVDQVRNCGLSVTSIEEIEPQLTMLLDLKLSEEELRHNLSSGHRSAINGAERRGLSFAHAMADADYEAFIYMMSATARRAHINTFEPQYFRTLRETLSKNDNFRLYIAEFENRIVAACVIFTTPDTWYYAFAASDPENVKLQAGAPLLWQAILDAKAAGAGSFDLWGIVPTDTKSAKSGYSHFKRAFGGTTKAYSGSWDVIVSPAKYRTFQMARSVGRVIRELRR